MIYIDPPYNTGKDFVYKDNYRDNLKKYREAYGQRDEEGNIVSSQAERNSESDGKYHAQLVEYDVSALAIGAKFMREDGVSFLSIDDTEVYNLQKVGDEVLENKT